MFKKNKLFLALIIFFSILASRELFQSGYFPMHDDLQMMRQLQLEKCFSDSQIPCRWVSDMGYGFGYPLFNFYPPLPYLIGQGIRFLGFHFTTTARMLFFLSFLLSGVSMYLFAKEFFGRLGGFLSSIFYIWAPYHAVDVYVRGAMNESWAMIFFPLILLSSYKLIVEDKQKGINWLILLALSYFGLFTSHNLMVLIFTPVFAFWILLLLWHYQAWKKLPQLFIAGIWSFGLAAFFTLPALLENSMTHIRSQLTGYYDYTAHFVSVRQLLFSRFWGYGPSVWVEAEDKMSFQIGHLHWIGSLIVGFVMLAKLIAKKGNFIEKFKKDKLLLLTSYFFLVGWLASFMTHLRSIFIYHAIPQLSYIQFPWRFLTLSIFAFSFTAGYLVHKLPVKRKLFGFVFTWFRATITIFLVIFLVVFNWNYFKPERWGQVSDEEKFSGEAWRIQQTAGIYDYLPETAEMAPQSQRAEPVEVLEGNAQISNYEQGSYWATFKTLVNSNDAVERLNILYFPNWKIFVDGVETQISIPDNEEWGRMWFKVSQGEHLVYAQIFNTPVRTVSNIISLVSWFILLSFPLWKKKLATN